MPTKPRRGIALAATRPACYLVANLDSVFFIRASSDPKEETSMQPSIMSAQATRFGSSTRQRVIALTAAATVLGSLFVIAAPAAPVEAARPKCEGVRATIVSRNRVIRGTNRADVIVARGRKNNRIYGRGGRDRICAGKGNDRVFGGGGRDIISGGPGRDTLNGGSGGDRLDGNGSGDRLIGSSGDDLLFGDRGADVLHGGPGEDLLEGEGGADELYGELDDDPLYGGSGNDELYGGSGNDDLDGEGGGDRCEQGSGSGSIVRCETLDLEISVKPFYQANREIYGFEARVFNNGPDEVFFEIIYVVTGVGLTCGPGPGTVQRQLAAGAETTQEEYILNCTGASGFFVVEGTVEIDGYDPDDGNNYDQDSAVKS